jgi:YbbR domain-containing protein
MVDYRKILLKIAENWPAKVLSVALAIVLFVFHQTSTMQNRFFSVPLHVETDGNYTPSSPYDHTIRVSMRGEANSIYPILENDIEAYIDLKGKEKGTYHTPVQIRKKGTALGVDPLELTVEPIEVSLTIDHKVSKYVPIAANIRGNLKDGYTLASSTLTPSQVVIDGPSDVISAIAVLSTGYIDLDERDEDFSVVVNIANEEPLVAIRGDGTVEFKGVVEGVTAQRALNTVPIVLKDLDARFSATLDTNTGAVTLSGKRQAMDQFAAASAGQAAGSADNPLLTVDCSAITEAGSYPLAVTANAPAGLTLTRSSPQTVTVTVTEIEETTSR